MQATYQPIEGNETPAQIPRLSLPTLFSLAVSHKLTLALKTVSHLMANNAVRLHCCCRSLGVDTHDNLFRVDIRRFLLCDRLLPS